jgi:hypothetical protein
MATSDGGYLRPLTLAELLDRTFSLYRRHVILFVGIMALPSIVSLAWALGMEALRFGQVRAAPTAQPMAPTAVWSYVVPVIITGLGVGLIYLVVYVAALGATTAAVSDLYLGHGATIASAYRRVRPRIGRLSLLIFWVTLRVGLVAGGLAFGSVAFFAVVDRQMPILAALVLFGGMGLSVIAFFLLTLRYSVAVPVATLESMSAHRSVGRSVHLTKGYLGRLFLLVVCGTIVTYAAIMVLQVPFLIGALVVGPATSQGSLIRMAGVVLGTIGSTFVAPIPVIGLALMYYDFRVRKEGLDLDLMLGDLGRAAMVAPDTAIQG